MRIRERQLIYGTIIGAGTFLSGCFLTALFIPDGFLNDVETWRVVAWVYLNAHFVQIVGETFAGITLSTVDLIGQTPALRVFRVVPVLLLVSGGLLMIETIGYTSRFTHLIQNSWALLIGYLGTGLIAFVLSDAQPGVSSIIMFGLIAIIALAIGSAFLGAVVRGIPMFGIVSLGGIFLIGLLIILSGIQVLQAIWPFLAVSVSGTALAAVFAWAARNAPN